ncbi:MAG: acyltransferase [Muribaculaceae bacterium]|nr:acyltransferase [Muribaculaceae bacterium]
MNSSNRIEPGTGRTKRIEYIDALRGFTMFLVVSHHISNLCFNVVGGGLPSITKYLLQIRMPLFFFISGFVLYKAGVVWDTKQIVSFFKKKIPVQLISPFIFFLTFVFVTDKNLVESLFADGKVGYWFTYVLFEYFVLYAAVRFCIRSKWADVVLVILGICLYSTRWPDLKYHIPVPEHVLSLLSFEHWYLFLFFAMGTLVKKHFKAVEKLLDNNWLITICVLFYFLSNAFKLGNVIPELINYPLLSLTGVIIVFSFFRKKQAIFTKQTTLGRVMQYTGRRTLDIYLIHYFFIPYNLTFFTVFKDHPMPIVEFTVSAIIAIIIIAACLLVSNIIRLSPFLAHWLFGAKREQKAA